MSLNDRFTQLRRPDFQVRGVLGGRVDTLGGGSTAKNKKLALQMSRRPTVVAALARDAFEGIKSSAQQNGFGMRSDGYSPRGYNNFNGRGGGFRRNFNTRGGRRGRGGSVGGGLRRSDSWGNLSNVSQSSNFRRGRSRSRGRERGGGGGGFAGRSSSLGRYQRSSSVTSMRSNSSFKFNGGRGGGRGRGRGGVRGGGRGGVAGRMYRSASLSSLNTSFRGRGRGRGRGVSTVSRGFVNRRDQNRRGGRGGFNRGQGTPVARGRGGFRGRGGQRGVTNRGGRGGFANRGAGRGRGGRWTKEPAPDRNTLDKELDQYMSGSRAHLDKELDNYMNQT